MAHFSVSSQSLHIVDSEYKQRHNIYCSQAGSSDKSRRIHSYNGAFR